MRFPIVKELSLEDLKSKLEAEFPGIICKFRMNKILVVNEPGTSAAAMVMVKKDKAIVNEGFSSMGAQLTFVLCLFGFGIVIPAIVYGVAFFPKQKAIRNKIGEFVKANYGALEVK